MFIVIMFLLSIISSAICVYKFRVYENKRERLSYILGIFGFFLLPFVVIGAFCRNMQADGMD
jgi:amino acid transporter